MKTSFRFWIRRIAGFPGGSEGKVSACNVGDLGLIPELGRSPGEGNSNPLQYCCLENPMDGEACWATYSPWGHRESDATKWLHFHFPLLAVVIRKDLDAGKDWKQEEKGTTEDEMVGWNHWLDGHEFQQALGVGYGQGSLACCSSWSRKELDTTEQLNWAELAVVIRNISLPFITSLT